MQNKTTAEKNTSFAPFFEKNRKKTLKNALANLSLLVVTVILC